jgi:hypothetical protein
MAYTSKNGMGFLYTKAASQHVSWLSALSRMGLGFTAALGRFNGGRLPMISHPPAAFYARLGPIFAPRHSRRTSRRLPSATVVELSCEKFRLRMRQPAGCKLS